jgi:hypothetical protein
MSVPTDDITNTTFGLTREFFEDLGIYWFSCDDDTSPGDVPPTPPDNPVNPIIPDEILVAANSMANPNINRKLLSPMMVYTHTLPPTPPSPPPQPKDLPTPPLQPQNPPAPLIPKKNPVKPNPPKDPDPKGKGTGKPKDASAPKVKSAPAPKQKPKKTFKVPKHPLGPFGG